MVYDVDIIERMIHAGVADGLVYFSEEKHKVQFEMLLQSLTASDMGNNNEKITDAVFVTGPSASGKTTFTNILKEMLESEGYNCSVISLDSYYRSRDEIQRIQSEKAGRLINWEHCDYESPDTLDTDFFKEQMTRYINGESIIIPDYDFHLGDRVPGHTEIKSSKKDMLLIEGIHALNPIISGGLSFGKKYNIFLCPFDSYTVKNPDNERETDIIKPEQIRMMRRSYRDSLHRNAPLSVNLKMWKNVLNGEEKYIYPMKKYADFFFNTSITYEILFLAGRFLAMTETLNEEEKQYLKQFIDVEVLKRIEPYYGFNVLDNSIFSEFCR